MATSYRRRDPELDRELYTTAKWLTGAFFLGCVTILLRFRSYASGEMVVNLIWGLAWLGGGFLFGFLFGIPKALQQGGQTPPGTLGAAASAAPAPRFRVNTNLEEISDWLTKILVGATLTQLVKVPTKIAQAGAFMARGGQATGATSFACAILMYFSALGFLAGYLMTRTYLSRLFDWADGGGQDALVIEKAEELARSTTAATSGPVREQVYTSLSYMQLYQPPPDGFQRALAAVAEYYAKGGQPNASIEINRACAFGQQVAYLRQTNAPADEIAKSRDGALAAVKQALSLQPACATLLRQLLWVTGSPEENDLAVFQTDPEFAELLPK